MLLVFKPWWCSTGGFWYVVYMYSHLLPIYSVVCTTALAITGMLTAEDQATHTSWSRLYVLTRNVVHIVADLQLSDCAACHTKVCFQTPEWATLIHCRCAHSWACKWCLRLGWQSLILQSCMHRISCNRNQEYKDQCSAYHLECKILFSCTHLLLRSTSILWHVMTVSLYTLCCLHGILFTTFVTLIYVTVCVPVSQGTGLFCVIRCSSHCVLNQTMLWCHYSFHCKCRVVGGGHAEWHLTSCYSAMLVTLQASRTLYEQASSCGTLVCHQVEQRLTQKTLSN